MGGNGKPWEAMGGHGRAWQEVVGGQSEAERGHGRPWEAMGYSIKHYKTILLLS